MKDAELKDAERSVAGLMYMDSCGGEMWSKNDCRRKLESWAGRNSAIHSGAFAPPVWVVMV